MGKPRMEQLHGPNMQLWNFKGQITSNAWAPTGVISSDAWHVTANVTINDVNLRSGDLVISLSDDPDALSQTTISAGSWKVIRHLSDEELQYLSDQLYTPPSASLTGGTTLEKNYSASPYSASLSWTVTAGTNPITTKELQKKESGGSWVYVKDLTGNSGTETVSVTINTDTQFRVYVSSKDGEAIYSSTRTVEFKYKTGFKIDSSNPSIDSAWLHVSNVTGVSGMSFDTDAFGTFTANAGSNQHIFYFVPKSFVSSPYIRPPYFYVAGFEGGFDVHKTDALYTLGDGTQIEYVVYRSAQPSLGNTTVTVQST